MRAMKSMTSMKMAAVRRKPAMGAMKSLKAKKKPAVRMKPAMRAMKSMKANKGHEVNECGRISPFVVKTKDDQIVHLRVQLEVLGYKVTELLGELQTKRAEVAAAHTKIAMLQEEKKKQVAIVPETGDLWVKAGDVVFAIKLVPQLGPADVNRATEPPRPPVNAEFLSDWSTLS